MAGTTTPSKRHSAEAVPSRRHCRVCTVVSFAALLVVTVTVTVLVVTALRPRTTAVTLEDLRLVSLSLSDRDPAGTTPSLNATLDADLAIRNPSPVAAFASDAGRAEVYYRGALAADTNLPPGRVDAGGTEKVTVRLTVLADRLVAYAPQLFADLVGAGNLPLTVTTVLPGKVTVFGVLRRRVVVTTVCDVVVSVRSSGTETSSCQYHTKL